MKICPAGVDFFPCRRIDGRTDEQADRHVETNSRLSQFLRKRLQSMTWNFAFLRRERLSRPKRTFYYQPPKYTFRM